MSARPRHIDLGSLLSFIKENGPISKSELHARVLGYPYSKPMIAALHELESRNLITYRYGVTKGRRRRAMVYEARAG